MPAIHPPNTETRAERLRVLHHGGQPTKLKDSASRRTPKTAACPMFPFEVSSTMLVVITLRFSRNVSTHHDHGTHLGDGTSKGDDDGVVNPLLANRISMNKR